MKNSPFLSFIKLSRPFFLLGGVGQFILGVGIANYLGRNIDWTVFGIGLGWVLTMQLATHYLNEYFDAFIDQFRTNRTPFSGGSGVLGEGEDQLPRSVALVAAVGMLTITTFLTLSLIWKGHLNLSIGVVMVMIFLMGFFYSVPPVKLSHTGYGELTTAFLVANLIPAFGFMLQTGEIHRLVSLATIPLTFILLSVLLAIQFPDYLTDVKFRKRNLLVRLGWENAMYIHNTFILFSFVILGVVSLFGLPSSISIPAFLPLPLGLLQIWQMRRISAGLKPNWTTLILNAIVSFGLMSYMLAFGFWTR